MRCRHKLQLWYACFRGGFLGVESAMKIGMTILCTGLEPLQLARQLFEEDREYGDTSEPRAVVAKN